MPSGQKVIKSLVNWRVGRLADFQTSNRSDPETFLL
jgi:hypothetical protein